MKCPNPKCQTENKSKSKYCVQCGTSLEISDKQSGLINTTKIPKIPKIEIPKIFKGKNNNKDLELDQTTSSASESVSQDIEKDLPLKFESEILGKLEQNQLVDIIIKQASDIEKINKKILNLEQEVEKLKAIED